jgi:hypothetical protein
MEVSCEQGNALFGFHEMLTEFLNGSILGLSSSRAQLQQLIGIRPFHGVKFSVQHVNELSEEQFKGPYSASSV